VVGEVTDIAQNEQRDIPKEHVPLMKSNHQNEGIDHAGLTMASVGP